MDVTVSEILVGDETEADITWLVEDGAVVEADQVIAELETAKSTAEVVAGVDGTLTIQVRSGETVLPETIIATIL
jgi:pyruvate/2-oxoglutarate dehydrogenase complex dihydrolipoamide acyltransferase (E2) component